MQRPPPPLQLRLRLVSILIRPEGRMQPGEDDEAGGNSCFNPHPARRPDATREGNAMRRDRTVSILIRPEGRMQLKLPVITLAPAPVSILIRPEGRMQPSAPTRTSGPSMSFNPHPARRPDATGVRGTTTCGCTSFNPHPARRPDATTLAAGPGADQPCFNPHPARRPDATRRPRCLPTRQATVSILIRPEGRMQPTKRFR